MVAIAVDGYPSDLAVGAGSVWVALGPSAELQLINPDQNVAASTISALGKDTTTTCGGPFASIALGAGSAWFVCRDGPIGRINARTLVATTILVELVQSSSAVLAQFSDTAFGLGSLWIVNSAFNRVVEVEPLTTQVQQPTTVGKEPKAIAVGADSLWVANFDDDTVTRIAIPERGQTPTVSTIDVGQGPVDVAFAEGAVWVVNQLDRTVMRIDPESENVVATIPVGNEPQRVAAGEGSVWVTVRAPEEDSFDADSTTP